MDASEKILRAFVFRLALLVLAVFAARQLPDHSVRTASTAPVELAHVECAPDLPLGDKATEAIDDMRLQD